MRTFGLKQTLAILFAGLSNQAADYVTDYERDFYGRVTQIDQSGTAAPGQLAITRKVVDLEYNRLGSLDSITRSVAVWGSLVKVAESDYAYFETGYLQSITHEDLGGTEIGGYSWDYDLAGQVTSFTAPEGTTAYAYDNTGQLIGGVLTAAGVTTASEDFDYDDTGNRLSQTTDGVTTSNLVSRNRLLSDGKYNYTYDDNGNRTQKLEIASGDYQDFTWDHRNRLTSIEFRDSAGTLQQAVRYSYDAFDQRILSELDADGDGTFEQFDRAVWDRSEVALVLDDAGAVQHRFLHGPGVDQVFADESATDGLLWYLTDNQNSVRDVIDSSGTLLNHLSYSTFGKITAESDPNQTPYFAYTGREFDEVTGLQYNRARYYDAETGRWLNNDPIGFAAGDTNIQRYVGNSPTNYTDPSGLFSSGDNNHNLGKREAAVERLAEILARIARLEVMQNSGRWPEGSYVMGLIQATLNSLDAEIDALEKLFPGGEVKFINDQLDGLNGAKRLEDLRDGMNAAADEFEKEMKKYAKKCAIEAGLAYVGGKAASTVFKKASAYLKSRRKFRELQEKLRKQKRRPKTDQSQGGEFVDDALRTPAANTPFRPNSLKHIFRPKHNLVDTPGNRKLLRAIADDAASFVGKNKHGNEVFQRLMPDGSQIWVWVRNGKIFDGGRNLIPKIFP